MSGQRLVVFAVEMIQEIVKDTPARHLDLFQGETAPKSRARDYRVGEGRPAVQWARFIRIPSLWEAVFELGSHYPGPHPTPHRRARHDPPHYARAAAIVARNWLVSLRLPHEIVWAERVDGKPANLIHRPGSGKWERSTESLYRILRSEPNPGVALERPAGHR